MRFACFLKLPKGLLFSLLNGPIGLLLLVLLYWGCASQGVPTGGLKDETPPNLRVMIPRDQSVNVNTRTITLEFDEFIKTGNLQNELTISPYTEAKFKTNARKNRLEIIFEEDFKPNTTYTINFGTSIQDITEANKVQNLGLAFSTGPVIDSLTLRGRVYDMLTGRPMKACAVSLYNSQDTLDINEDKPLYVTRSDTSGVYQFKNLKMGDYKVYAISEAKPDLIYKGKDEVIGFMKYTLPLSKNLAGVNLRTLYYDLKPLQIASSRSRKQYFELKFNKKVADYKLSFFDKTLDTLVYHQLTNELLTFYHKSNSATDTLLALLEVTDSVGNQIKDTIKVKFNEGRPAKLNVPIVQEYPANGTKILKDQGLPLTFKFSKPILKVNLDSIRFKMDKDTVWSAFTEAAFVWNHNRTELKIEYEFKPLEKVDFSAKQGAFITVEADSVPIKVLAYPVAPIEDFGTVTGTVKGSSSNYIVQIINELNVVEQEQQTKGPFNFQRLIPGNKRVRVFVDSNDNKIWDKGSFKERIVPERVIVDTQIIPLKANWELGIEPIDTDAADSQ